MKQKENQIVENKKVDENRMVRILSRDIEGKTNVYSGLTKIKGISWSISNAICKKIKIDKKRKTGSLTIEETKKIEEFMKNPELPSHLKNRKKDFFSGEDIHLVGTELELKKDFDIKRLRKIKSYRGLRHASNLPLRGQRTKSHFRGNRTRGVGIKKKKK